LDGTRLENLQIGVSLVKFYWLIPVTLSEIDFKKKHGLEALEREFERKGVDYLNPRRHSLA
jgi:hypothetical protein